MYVSVYETYLVTIVLFWVAGVLLELATIYWTLKMISVISCIQAF